MLEVSISDDVVVARIDDGKANAVGHAFVDAVNEALDRSESEEKALLLQGRPGVFSAGFDLKELQKGEAERNALVSRGAEMLLRTLSHPRPVVACCEGHAIAAGALLLLACDTRIGAGGDFKLGLNETAIGMPLPVFGTELARLRLDPRAWTAAVTQARLYDPAGAAGVGFLDEVTRGTAEHRAREVAAQLAELPAEAYAANKLSMRASAIATIQESLNG